MRKGSGDRVRCASQFRFRCRLLSSVYLNYYKLREGRGEGYVPVSWLLKGKKSKFFSTTISNFEHEADNCFIALLARGLIFLLILMNNHNIRAIWPCMRKYSLTWFWKVSSWTDFGCPCGQNHWAASIWPDYNYSKQYLSSKAITYLNSFFIRFFFFLKIGGNRFDEKNCSVL